MKATDENLLRRSSLFQFLTEEHFEKWSALLQEESYEFGDLLVRQGDPADAFYVLASGRARVVKTDQSGDEIALATLKPGDSFGESALIAGGTRTATVRCSMSSARVISTLGVSTDPASLVTNAVSSSWRSSSSRVSLRHSASIEIGRENDVGKSFTQ